MKDILDRKNAGLMAVISFVVSFACGMIQYILMTVWHQDIGIMALGFLFFWLVAFLLMLRAAGIFHTIWEFIKKYTPILALVALGLLVYQWFMRDLTTENIAVWAFVGTFIECARQLGLYFNKKDESKKSTR